MAKASWVPLVFVLSSLAALVAVPLVVRDVNARDRRFVEEVVDPAEEAADRLQEALSQEGAAIRGYTMRPGAGFAREYAGALAREEQAFEELSAFAVRLGPEVERAFREARRTSARWSARHEQLLRDEITTEEYFDDLADQQALFAGTITSAAQLEAEIENARYERLEAIGRAFYWQSTITIGLALLALFSGMVVIGLNRRLRAQADALTRRAEESELIAQISRDLMAVSEAEQLTMRIAERAREAAGADASFVERVDREQGEVTVIATNGEGAPKRGTRVPYPGSQRRSCGVASPMSSTTSPARSVPWEGCSASPAAIAGAWSCRWSPNTSPSAPWCFCAGPAPGNSSGARSDTSGFSPISRPSPFAG